MNIKRLLPFAPSQMGEGGRRPDEGPFFCKSGSNKTWLYFAITFSQSSIQARRFFATSSGA